MAADELLRLVVVRQSIRDVPTPGAHAAYDEPDERVRQALTEGEVQLLGAAEVALGGPEAPPVRVHDAAVAQQPGFPELVAGPAEGRQCLPVAIERLVEASETLQHRRAAHLQPCRLMA